MAIWPFLACCTQASPSPPAEETREDVVDRDVPSDKSVALPWVNACGKERWAVKVGSDTGARRPMPLLTRTIGELRAKARPPKLPSDARLDGVETTVYQLSDVQLVGSRHEADGDLHLVLADAAGATIVAEIPDPSCVAVKSPWYAQIAGARAAASSLYPPELEFGPGTFVSVRGVGFFDREHGQIGAAPNGIELHPVLAFCFGAGCWAGLPRWAP